MNKPWVVGVLAVAAVVLIGFTLFEQSPGATPRTISSSYADEGDLVEYDAPDGADREVPAIVEALRTLVLPEEFRDPFVPATRDNNASSVVEITVRGPDEIETLTLSAVWRQGDTLLLVINGRIHHVGDRIGRMTIVSADLDGAWLSHWKGRDYLPFGDVFTLVTPAATTANSTPDSDET